VRGKIVVQASVSVDGFIADETGNPGPLFDWYRIGDTAASYGDDAREFQMSETSAAYVAEIAARTGACVIGDGCSI
jgi:hypothetical protein